MKEFKKWVLAVLVGLLIWGIIKAVLAFTMIGAIASSSSESSSSAKLPKEGILLMDMSTLVITEQGAEDDIFATLNGTGVSQVGLLNATAAIRKAAEDPGIKCILLKTDGQSIGVTKMEELRKSLLEFRKSGKAIVAYGEMFTSGSYYLASVADKIYTTSHHGGNNMMVGLSGRMIFLKDLLDKLGVNYQLIRHGKYKSAGEMYVKNEASPENMLQNQEMVNSTWETIAEETAQARGIQRDSLEYFISNLSINYPEDMVKHGLADAVLSVEEYKEKIAILGEKDSYKDVKMIPFSEYASTKGKAVPAGLKNKIAVIFANGNIIEDKDPQNICGETFAKIIAKVRADSTVKAVVFRVNSPGGTVLASSKIKEEIDLTRKVKPVIASYGDYAASGGYWISNSCDHIFTNRTTLTGSIGVFSAIPEFSKTLKNVAHINMTPVNSHPHADMLSLTRPFDAQETAWMQDYVDDIYNSFVATVAEGRDLTFEAVDEIAQGRVWTGLDAIKIGLVDDFGTLDDAIAYAASAAGDPEVSNWGIATYPKAMTQFETIISKISGKSTDEEEVSVIATCFDGTPLEKEARDVMKWVRTWADGDQPQSMVFAKMPYIMEIK